MIRNAMLVAAIALITGCTTLTANPANTPAVTYEGIRGQREVKAQCPVGQALTCQTANDMVGAVGLSCRCYGAR